MVIAGGILEIIVHKGNNEIGGTCIYVFIDAAIKDFAYCYSITDVFKAVEEEFQQQASGFLNDDTENLFNLFRKWTASQEEIDFEEGFDVAESFMTTCFGITFYDGPNGRLDLVPFCYS